MIVGGLSIVFQATGQPAGGFAVSTPTTTKKTKTVA
jgi:hypothetical protein